MVPNHKEKRFLYVLELLLEGKVPCRVCHGDHFYLTRRRRDGALVWYCRRCYAPRRNVRVLGNHSNDRFIVRKSLINRAIGNNVACQDTDECIELDAMRSPANQGWTPGS